MDSRVTCSRPVGRGAVDCRPPRTRRGGGAGACRVIAFFFSDLPAYFMLPCVGLLLGATHDLRMKPGVVAIKPGAEGITRGLELEDGRTNGGAGERTCGSTDTSSSSGGKDNQVLGCRNLDSSQHPTAPALRPIRASAAVDYGRGDGQAPAAPAHDSGTRVAAPATRAISPSHQHPDRNSEAGGAAQDP
jgi:hypothetical protein